MSKSAVPEVQAAVGDLPRDGDFLAHIVKLETGQGSGVLDVCERAPRRLHRLFASCEVNIKIKKNIVWYLSKHVKEFDSNLKIVKWHGEKQLDAKIHFCVALTKACAARGGDGGLMIVYDYISQETLDGTTRGTTGMTFTLRRYNR